MTNKFTPGPWYFLPMGDTLSLVGNNGNRVIAELPSLSKFEGIAFTPSEEDEANYRLIHSAPEMFEALERMAAFADEVMRSGYVPEDHPFFSTAHHAKNTALNAIRKARGE